MKPLKNSKGDKTQHLTLTELKQTTIVKFGKNKTAKNLILNTQIEAKPSTEIMKIFFLIKLKNQILEK